MRRRGGVLLTGATGFLGRYLLRELLASGQRVAVLARPGRSGSAAERVAELLASVNARPVVLTGDLNAPGLGLRGADRDWLARHCRSVVHAAARVSLRRSADGEPCKTNVRGTENLLGLCAEFGLRELHHVSTAFVCGDRVGPAREDELDRGQGFHNEYEGSKLEAERRVRSASGLRATIYRPAIIVGDSRTGYTSSYLGFYRFLDLADRLAGPVGADGRRSLPLRLPFTGDEPRNLVPVDWVARAIVRIVNRPRWHGQTYHLVAPVPVRVRAIKEVAERMLNLDGVRCAGPRRPADATHLEEMFLDHLEEYWPYLGGDPSFDYRNTLAALPTLPAPRVGRAMLARLIRFAVADGWGRSRRGKVKGRAADACAHYIEQFFPDAARRSTLARVRLDVTVVLDVRGPGGGRWLCRWVGGELVEVQRDPCCQSEVGYRMDVDAFAAIVRGTQSPQQAFFEQRLEMIGDVEKGLKLAMLFEEFIREFPFEPDREEMDVPAVLA
jgi:thioester reductase-like protein